MAVETPPSFTQANTFGAEQTRRTIGSLLQRGASIGSVIGGLVGLGDCLLTPPGSGMTVNIAPGEVWVPGSSAATQSGYYCRVSSSTSLSIATSSPSNPRIDRISAIVTDAAYSGATNTFAVAVQTGTATAGATLANLNGVAAAPASSYTLGYVLVPTSATNIVSADILNAASLLSTSPSPLSLQLVSSSVTVADGQALVVNGSSAVTVTLPSPVLGAYLSITSFTTGGTTVSGVNIFGYGLNAATSFPLSSLGANVTLLGDGVAWIIVAGQQDTGWVSVTSMLGAGLSNGGFDTSVRLRGDTVAFKGAIENVSGSTIGASSTMLTLPAIYRPVVNRFQAGTGWAIAGIFTTGIMWNLNSLVNTATINLDGLTFPTT